MTTVLAPVPGLVVALAGVPDPVFAAAMVGPGLAIDPVLDSGPLVAVAPLAGRLVKLHPHAFVIQSGEGAAVLVHLGIDTVQLRGEGFELRCAEGDELPAGRPVVAWDAAAVAAGGRSPVCPVVALEAAGIEALVAAGTRVAAGAPLFTVG